MRCGYNPRTFGIFCPTRTFQTALARGHVNMVAACVRRSLVPDKFAALVSASDVNAVSAEIGIVHVHKFYRADVTRSVRKIDLGCRNEPRAVRVIVTRYVARNFNDFHLIAGTVKRFSACILARNVNRIVRGCSVRTDIVRSFSVVSLGYAHNFHGKYQIVLFHFFTSCVHYKAFYPAANPEFSKFFNREIRLPHIPRSRCKQPYPTNSRPMKRRSLQEP